MPPCNCCGNAIHANSCDVEKAVQDSLQALGEVHGILLGGLAGIFALKNTLEALENHRLIYKSVVAMYGPESVGLSVHDSIMKNFSDTIGNLEKRVEELQGSTTMSVDFGLGDDETVFAPEAVQKAAEEAAQKAAEHVDKEIEKILSGMADDAPPKAHGHFGLGDEKSTGLPTFHDDELPPDPSDDIEEDEDPPDPLDDGPYPCTKCDGTGHEDAAGTKCYRCEGTGVEPEPTALPEEPKVTVEANDAQSADILDKVNLQLPTATVTVVDLYPSVATQKIVNGVTLICHYVEGAGYKITLRCVGQQIGHHMSFRPHEVEGRVERSPEGVVLHMRISIRAQGSGAFVVVAGTDKVDANPAAVQPPNIPCPECGWITGHHYGCKYSQETKAVEAIAKMAEKLANPIMVAEAGSGLEFKSVGTMETVPANICPDCKGVGEVLILMKGAKIEGIKPCDACGGKGTKPANAPGGDLPIGVKLQEMLDEMTTPKMKEAAKVISDALPVEDIVHAACEAIGGVKHCNIEQKVHVLGTEVYAIQMTVETVDRSDNIRKFLENSGLKCTAWQDQWDMEKHRVQVASNWVRSKAAPKPAPDLPVSLPPGNPKWVQFKTKGPITAGQVVYLDSHGYATTTKGQNDYYVGVAASNSADDNTVCVRMNPEPSVKPLDAYGHIWAEMDGTVHFGNGPQRLLTLHPDGRVTVLPGVELDIRAGLAQSTPATHKWAELFWKMVGQYNPLYAKVAELDSLLKESQDVGKSFRDAYIKLRNALQKDIDERNRPAPRDRDEAARYRFENLAAQLKPPDTEKRE